MASQAQSPDVLFEIGKLYQDRTDFLVAIDKIKAAGEGYYDARNYDGYFKCLNHLLRIYAEREDHDSIDETKEILQDLVIKEKVELNAKTYYSLALCASYKGQHETALEYIEKSLALALAEDDKINICYAISGLAIVYTALGRLEDALKEIYNLKIFFQVLDVPEIKLSSQLMNGHILRMLGKYDQALDVYWQCYENLKTEKNLYFYVSLLFAMGVTYADSGDTDLAKMYLSLAMRSVDPKNVIFLTRAIKKRLSELGCEEPSKYDIIYDAAAKTVVEKKKGRVDFKNQFVLLDMLKLFLNNPGEVYSKEALVMKIWKQDYNPLVHDNKIYVTIKRLRKLIEPDYEQPKYIFRAKNGYYLNKNTRVLMGH